MKKNKTFIGSIVTGVIGILALIMGAFTGMEMISIQNSSASLVQAGSKTLSRSEYLEQAGGTVALCVGLGAVCVAVAVVLYLRAKKQNKAD